MIAAPAARPGEQRRNSLVSRQNDENAPKVNRMKRDRLVLAPTAFETSLASLTPFTPEHFALWATGLILDSGESWVVEPFQLAFLADVFAGVPECWLIIPEGNGKTTLIAGLVLYICEFSDMPSEIPVAGSSRDQAGILYKQAEGFVVRSEGLYERVWSELEERKGKTKQLVPRFMAQKGNRRILHYRGGCVQIYAADERTGDGVLFRLGVLDELHRHRDLDLYRTWSGKRLKRPGAQIIAISTAGEPGSEFENIRERIRQTVPIVERGECFLRAVNSSIALHEWAVPEAGNVEDLELAARANPFSGVTAEVLRAKFDSPTMTLSHWRRFTCNLPTRSNAAAITELEWTEAKTAERIPEGMPIWLGLDVAYKWDTTAMVPFLLTDLDHRLFGPATVLIPPRDGTSLDPDLIENSIRAINERNPIHTVVMDSTRAEQLGSWLEREIGAIVVDRSQTASFQALDCEAFLDGLRGGQLKHAGDPELTAHALNAIAVEQRDGKRLFARPKASRFGGDQQQQMRAIDALVAAAMVHCVAVAEASTEETVPLVAWS